MPRILLFCAVIGCGFDADYKGGHFTCYDDKCPSGLTCNTQHECVTTMPGDAAHDAPIDTPQAALTCADPGVLPAGGGSASGSTGKNALMSALCNGLVMNGYDAVYVVDANLGNHIKISLLSGPLKAYALAPCSPSPATPTCVGNVFATVGNPITIIAAATTPHYIVVDDDLAAGSGAYSLSVMVTP
jgi:hypothetical protein